MNPRQHSLTKTPPPPRDDLAARREQKHSGHLTPAQVRRLLAAAALREKVTQGENDE